MDEQSEANEQRAAFIADAVLGVRQVPSAGVGYDADEVHRYICASMRDNSRIGRTQSLGGIRYREM